MLVLKLTDSNRRAHGGFQWPNSGTVECPDWDPEPRCGGGLHGWANGCGAYRHSFNEGQWLVVDVPDGTVVPIDGGEKVKFPRGTVVYCGNRTGAVARLIKHGALTADSDPALACFTTARLVELAMRATDRAVRKHAPKALRARGLVEAAEKLEKLPRIKDRKTAAASASASAADAAADADAAAAAAYAAAAAAYATTAASASATTADAAADAASAAADAARAEEQEQHRQDKLELLGLKHPGRTARAAHPKGSLMEGPLP